MTSRTGPFQVDPQPGDSFRLDAPAPLDAQWSTLLGKLSPRTETFVVRDADARFVYFGARPVETLTDDADVTAMTFDPSGRWIATGHDDGSVRLWEVGNPDPVWSHEPADEPIEGLAIVEQGPWVLAWCEDGPLLVMARDTGDLVTRMEDPQFASFTVTVSPRGDEVAITGPSVMRISLPGGEMRARLDADRASDASSGVQWVEYLDDASMLIGVRSAGIPGGDDEVVFWNGEHGARIATIPGLRGVCACDLSPDRSTAAIATSDGTAVNLHLIDTRLHTVSRSIALLHASIYDLRFSADGRSVWVTGLESGTTRVNVAGGSIGTPVERDLSRLCVPADGKIVPDTDESDPIMVTRTPSGSLELTHLETRGPFGPIGRAVSANGARYAFSDESGDNNHVLLCDAATNRVIATLAHRANAREIWLSPDGTRVAVRAAGHVHVWSVPEQR